MYEKSWMERPRPGTGDRSDMKVEIITFASLTHSAVILPVNLLRRRPWAADGFGLRRPGVVRAAATRGRQRHEASLTHATPAPPVGRFLNDEHLLPESARAIINTVCKRRSQAIADMHANRLRTRPVDAFVDTTHLGLLCDAWRRLAGGGEQWKQWH